MLEVPGLSNYINAVVEERLAHVQVALEPLAHGGRRHLTEIEKQAGVASHGRQHHGYQYQVGAIMDDPADLVRLVYRVWLSRAEVLLTPIVVLICSVIKVLLVASLETLFFYSDSTSALVNSLPRGLAQTRVRTLVKLLWDLRLPFVVSTVCCVLILEQ